MTERRWTIAHAKIGEHPVTGFVARDTARDHAGRHLLNPTEHWEMVCNADEKQMLLELRQLVETEGKTEPLLDRAAELYEELVQRHTSHRPPYAGRATHRMQGSKWPQKRLYVVPLVGFFAAFDKKKRHKVSKLCTALRPFPRVRRGFLSNQHFLDASRRRLEAKLAQSGGWRSRKRTRN